MATTAGQSIKIGNWGGEGVEIVQILCMTNGAKGVIWGCKSYDRQHNGQNKDSNGPQNSLD